MPDGLTQLDAGLTQAKDDPFVLSAYGLGRHDAIRDCIEVVVSELDAVEAAGTLIRRQSIKYKLEAMLDE